jgi:pimeloyl-ACP methyl ester carboxylesterase
MWYGVIAALGSGVRAIAPDLPGFGRSGPPAGEPSIDVMADAVLAHLKNEGVERAVFAGMSMGGYVALAIAQKAKEKVAGLALVNSQTFADTDEARAGRRERIKKVRAEGAISAAHAILPQLFAPKRADDPDFKRFPIEGAEKAGIEGITWALEAMARRPDRSAIIADAKFPVLILHSVEDRLIPVEKARQIAALNPKTHFVLVKGAGHGAAIEAPDETASALRKFLEICSREKEAEVEAAAKT